MLPGDSIMMLLLMTVMSGYPVRVPTGSGALWDGKPRFYTFTSEIAILLQSLVQCDVKLERNA